MKDLTPVRNILFLAANPKDTGWLRLDEEVRDIQEGLRLSPGRSSIHFQVQWATRIQDLRRSLLEHTPHIVHFSGHGAGTEGLVLEDETGHAHCIQSATLARLFKLCPSVQCVLLNACYSQMQAEAIAQYVPYVIGMNQAIGDDVAIKFAVGFYDALGYGRSFAEAYEFGMTAIEAEPSIITRDIDTHPEAEFPLAPDPVIPVLIQSEQPSRLVKPSVSLSQKAYRDRQALLNKVKTYWIKGVLERSLHHRILIELGLEERLDFADPFNLAVSVMNEPLQPLNLGTQPIDVFDDLGEGRSLLILGEPGSGKTITLLQLARDLLARAEQDINHLIPVVFNLSSWNGKQPVADWLVEELNTKYQVPKAIGEPWIMQQQLLLLLDGLDEVAIAKREACVTALNQFQQTQGTELVVCSRIIDYEALSQRLMVQQAIYVRALQPAQIDRYLNALNADLTGLRQLLKADIAFQELARSPLMLNIMVLAYEGISPEDFPEMSVEAHRQQLFNTYIDRMLKRRGGDVPYSPKRTIQWLSWLAQQMVSSSQTIFLIEWLDREWLRTTQQRWMYTVLSSLIDGLAWSSIICLSVGLNQNWRLIGSMVWAYFTFVSIPMVWVTLMVEQMRPSPQQVFLQRLMGSLLTGLGGSMLAMVTGISRTPQEGWFVAGLTVPTVILVDWQLGGAMGLSFLKPVEAFRWSWINVRKYVVFALICSAPMGLLLGRTNVIGRNMIEGMLFTMLGGAVFGLLAGLRAGTEIETHTTPNQSIWRSAKTAVLVSVFVSILFVLVIHWLDQWLLIPPGWGVFFGLYTGLLMGGTACIVHVSLRLVFYWQSCMPWNYAWFLNHAAELAFLQKLGGGYIFIHRSLMEHFAQLKTP